MDLVNRGRLCTRAGVRGCLGAAEGVLDLLAETLLRRRVPREEVENPRQAAERERERGRGV